jgi:hypothetical protein
LPLSWQLLGCGLAGVPLSAWSSADEGGQGLTAESVIEQGQPGQRLGRAIEHQQADQQESFRHALLVKSCSPCSSRWPHPAANAGWGQPHPF